jgi:hypothetical protein
MPLVLCIKQKSIDGQAISKKHDYFRKQESNNPVYLGKQDERILKNQVCSA